MEHDIPVHVLSDDKALSLILNLHTSGIVMLQVCLEYFMLLQQTLYSNEKIKKYVNRLILVYIVDNIQQKT